MLRITGVEVPRSVGLRGSEKIAPHVDILLDGMVAQNPLFLGLVIDGVGGAVLSSTSLSKPPGMRNPFSTVYALEARGGGGGGIRVGSGGSKPRVDGQGSCCGCGDGSPVGRYSFASPSGHDCLFWVDRVDPGRLTKPGGAEDGPGDIADLNPPLADLVRTSCGLRLSGFNSIGDIMGETDGEFLRSGKGAVWGSGMDPESSSQSIPLPRPKPPVPKPFIVFLNPAVAGPAPLQPVNAVFGASVEIIFFQSVNW